MKNGLRFDGLSSRSVQVIKIRLTALTAMAAFLIAPLTVGSTQKSTAAFANLIDSKGNNIGKVQFERVNDGTQVTVQASGLPPGPHGIHVHKMGVCQPPSFQSAGDHLSASRMQEHGIKNPEGPHAGDLPNLEVKKDGTVTSTFITKRLQLSSEKDALLKEGGTTIIIHEKKDDQKTDPSGKSGDRIACGVVVPMG